MKKLKLLGPSGDMRATPIRSRKGAFIFIVGLICCSLVSSSMAGNIRIRIGGRGFKFRGNIPRAAQAEARQDTCSVVGIARGGTLSVHSRPGENNRVIGKLPAGTTGIQVLGRVVMNGGDHWVPIRFSSGKGWVRPKFLSRSQRTLPDASQRERQSDYAGKRAESKTSSRNTFNDAIDRYNLMELEYNEELVRQKKVAAAAGDDEARQWLRENEWRVKLVRSMYDATHAKQ